jgi:cell wall-associated NlpC family hydrolase
MEAQFVRELSLKTPRMQGRDAKAVQRALHRLGDVLEKHGFEEPTAEARYGRITENNVKIFQRHRGIEATGVYDEKTHRALCKEKRRQGGAHEDAVDGFCVWLFKHSQLVDARHRLKRAAMFAYSTAPWHYAGPGSPPDVIAKRMQGVREGLMPSEHPIFEDCSSGFTWLCFVSHIPDPNGRGYDGLGFTGTMVGQGKKVAKPGIGDAVFYGLDSVPDHVSMYLGDGKVWSHGAEGGPFIHAMDVHATPIREFRSYV